MAQRLPNRFGGTAGSDESGLLLPPGDWINNPLAEEPGKLDYYPEVVAEARVAGTDFWLVFSGQQGGGGGGTGGSGSMGTDAALTITRHRTGSAGIATLFAMIKPEQDDSEPPEVGDTTAISINGTQVFGGELSSAPVDDRGIYMLTAYDAKRRLRQSSFTGTFTDAPLGEVARTICQRAEVTVEIDQSLRLVGINDPPTITHDFQGMNSTRALTEVADRAGAIWWVDQRDTLHVSTEPDTRNLQLGSEITAPSGSQEPSFEKVVITGAGSQSGSTDGERTRPRASKNPVRGVAGNENAPDSRTYSPPPKPSITDQETAQNVADAVWDRYQKQRATGTVELAGRPDIGVLDVVTLRDIAGGGSYIVDSLTHEITEQHYRSTITCGGLADSIRGGGGAGDDTAPPNQTGTGAR